MALSPAFEGFVEELGGGLLIDFAEADGAAAESEDGDIHSGFAEDAFFHEGLLKRGV